MSLINQMLKDLAKRTKPLPENTVILSGLNASHQTLKKTNVFLWVSFLSLILFSLIMIFLIIHGSSRTTKKVSTPSSLPLTTDSNSKNVSSLQEVQPTTTAPALLTGITLETKEGKTHLRFFLNQQAHYQIYENSKDQLTILLDHTHLLTNLPQINTLESAINHIQITNLDNDQLKMDLKLNDGAELSHVELNTTSKLPELQIDLDYALRANPDTIKAAPEETRMQDQKNVSIKKMSYESSNQDHYALALHYSSKGQIDDAIALLFDFVDKQPQSIKARKLLVTLLMGQGDLEKANQIITEGLELIPYQPAFVLLKAHILVEKGHINSALSLLQASPPPLNKYPEYHAFIAGLYQQQNKINLAESLYEKLVVQQPDNATWWLGLGIARESLNKTPQALEAYKKANESGNLTPELRNYLEVRINNLV